jgi:hypothetical protein
MMIEREVMVCLSIFGEGQVGDMTLQRGNLAIASHPRDGKSLLLFRKAEGLRFLGEIYEKHHFEVAPDRDSKQRKAIVFELRALSAINELADDGLGNGPSKTLKELRALAKAAAGIAPPSKAVAFEISINAAENSATTFWLWQPETVRVARLLRLLSEKMALRISNHTTFDV